jgi:hypothetical protein
MTRVCGENVAVTRTGRKDCGQEKKILVEREEEKKKRGEREDTRDTIQYVVYESSTTHVVEQRSPLRPGIREAG